MTDKQLKVELDLANRGIFQAHCAINMCRKMLKEEFEYTDADVEDQVRESLGFMIDYTAYGIMSELNLSSDIGNENLNIVQDCIWNNYSVEDYKDKFVFNS